MQRLGQIRVDFLGLINIDRRDHRQTVVLNAVGLEPIQCGDDLLVAALTRRIDAKMVVDISRAVNAYTDQELILGQELTPVIIQQDAVCLQ